LRILEITILHRAAQTKPKRDQPHQAIGEKQDSEKSLFALLPSKQLAIRGLPPERAGTLPAARGTWFDTYPGRGATICAFGDGLSRSAPSCRGRFDYRSRL